MSETLLDKEQSQNKEVIPESQEVQDHRKEIEKTRELEANKAEKGNETEDARHEVEKANKDKEQLEQQTAKREVRKDTHVKGDKASRKLSFKKTMKDTRREMSAPSRAFSKLIHNNVVEKASDAVGSTIARPNVLLAGGLSAFILTTVIYVWARYVGYPLSGFETIAAFIIGYLIGIIFDFTRVMVTGKR